MNVVKHYKLCDTIEVRSDRSKDRENNIASGVDGFGEILEGLHAAKGLDQRRLVLVIADNDGDPRKRFGQVCTQIKNAGRYGVPTKPRNVVPPIADVDIGVIPDIAVLMLPWDGEHGCLESILYASGSDKNPKLAACVEKFASCAKITTWDAQRIAKFKARCMLSATARVNPEIPLGQAWRGDSGQPFPVTFSGFGKIVRYLKRISQMFTEKLKPKKSAKQL